MVKKKILLENFEYIITNYEEKIETLCENFDLDKDITENNLKKENKKSYTKIKLIISYIIIIGYVLVSGLPIRVSFIFYKNIYIYIYIYI